jgi:hypothetical protein
MKLKIILYCSVLHLVILYILQVICTFLIYKFPDYDGYSIIPSYTLGPDILLSNILFLSWFYYLMLENKLWGRFKVLSPLIILTVYFVYLKVKFHLISKYRYDGDFDGLLEFFPYELVLYLNLAVIFLNFQLGYLAHKFITGYLNRRRR